MKFSSKKSKSSFHLSPKRKIAKILIAIIIGIVVIVFLNFYPKEIRNFFYSISSPIQKTFWKAGDRASDFFKSISKIKNLKKENEELKFKIQELLVKSSSLKDCKKENETLREALKIGLEKDFKLALTQIVGKDISQDYILVDKGFKDGISEGLPVITPQKVLVGRVSKVFEKFSKILLISNQESSFDAKIQSLDQSFNSSSDVLGVVKGKGNFRLFLDLIPQDKEIFKGDIVISSSYGGIFPEGLLVGEITNVKKSDIEPFQQAEVKPFFDISQIEKLFIILDF